MYGGTRSGEMAGIPGLIQLIPEKERKHIEFITRTLKEAGEECYLVGGSVRDLVMGIIPAEYDLTTSAHPEKVKKCFKKVIETGIQHGTVTVLLDRIGYEVTTFRTEQGYSDGRRPDQVTFGASLSEDLERRDFTMNALALDVLEGKIIDEHGGRDDIQAKIIRTIGDPISRFSEDGLRPIRGIRFASTLGFRLEVKTEQAFLPTRNITEKIAVERFQVELFKILKSPSPHVGMDYLLKYEYLPIFLKSAVNHTPNTEILPLMKVFRENHFYDLDSLPWFFFLLIWMENLPKFSKINPIRELKNSSSIEKESLFFREVWNVLESFLSESEESISDFRIRKDLLSPMKDFTNKNPSIKERKENLLYEIVLEFTEFLSRRKLLPSNPKPKNNLVERIKTLYKQDIPLILSELSIDGNWIKKNFPEWKGAEIGKRLSETLQAIWKEELLNDPSSIEEYWRDRN